MRSFETGSPVRRERDCNGGMSMATTGVLFRNAEMTAVGTIIRTSVPGRVGFLAAKIRSIEESTPVRWIRAACTYSAAIVITAGSEGPAKDWLGVALPANSQG